MLVVNLKIGWLQYPEKHLPFFLMIKWFENITDLSEKIKLEYND